ncbi:MAG: DUF1275 domain-containing protein [Bifidobacterium sp.]|nr:DUF1275 domain-containing protein [Bifidobacterium sp.]
MSEPDIPVYESLAFDGLLTMIAGSIDAYSYLFHGGVFSGLQTGNIILLGINLGHGNLAESGRYLISLVAFMLGTVIAHGAQKHFGRKPIRVIRVPVPQLILAYEFALLLIVALTDRLVPDFVSTAVLSAAAAAELQEFRRLKGRPFTPLMMTGTLRALTEGLYDGVHYHDRASLRRSRDPIVVLVCFASGVMLVALARYVAGSLSIAVPMVLITAAILALYARQ